MVECWFKNETKIKQHFGPQVIVGIVEKVLLKINNEIYHEQIERAKLAKEMFEPFRGTLDAKLKKIKIIHHNDYVYCY